MESENFRQGLKHGLPICLGYFPVFSVLSGGWGIIVITLVVSAVAAVLFPIEVEEVHE